MSDTLLLLGLEHKNFGELLNLIEEQRYNLEDGGPVDINLLQRVAEYFSGYPDECHHPVEDLVLRRLCMRDSGAVPDPDRLAREHREIENLTRLLSKTVAAAASNVEAKTPELGEVMEQFVNYYRNHIMMEEKHFFSAAAELLIKDDWEAIEWELFDRDDPLFDRSSHERFQRLREKIDKSAREFSKRTFRLRQAKRVQQLRSISDFNKWAEERDCLLVCHPEGGYRLDLDGQAMVDIPACSEERAVSCAYYFLQGWATYDARG